MKGGVSAESSSSGLERKGATKLQRLIALVPGS